MKRYHLTTFGCQMNEHDSERMKGMLESLGYEESAERDGADLILFNTCSIRESADNRFIGNLGEAKRLKAEDPGRVVGVGGCWSQSLKDEVFARFPFVDVAFGPGQIHRLAEFLQADDLEAQGYFEFEGFAGDLPMKRERPFQAWVQISQGCNCVCSYCIVPSTRGRERSRSPREIFSEVERLACDGVREVTLLGQNVNSYGRDLPREERIDFADLLTLIDGVDGVERIRYTSPHPKDVREKLVRAHAELPSLCEHIHLPLQSGSSRVLKAMRRTYDRDRYMGRVEMIRASVPDCAITTDIIVGFPGESEDDFHETLEVVDVVGYDSAYTFLFSPRRGTEAAELPEQVPHAVKRERMARLVDLVQRRAHERGQRFVGTTQEVLVEGPSRTAPEKVRGRTRHNKTVNFEGLVSPGELVDVQITGATSTTLAGELPLLAHVTGARNVARRVRRIVALFGPTAVGKTEVAVALADLLRERGEDPVGVSADAFQVYEGLDVLTAKPDAGELDRLEHRLVSAIPVDHAFSVAEFAERGHEELDSLLASGRRPILVGGTGLYLRAALTDLDLKPAPDTELREEIESDLAALGAVALHARLQPETAEAVHPRDRKRIVRALELERMGEPPPRSSEQLWSDELRRPAALFGVVMEREQLRRRIEERVERILEEGAVEEVERALERGASRTARKAIGFAEIEAFLEGSISLDEARERIARRHRQYAKRQLTWMRKLAAVELIDRTGIDASGTAAAVAARLPE